MENAVKTFITAEGRTIFYVDCDGVTEEQAKSFLREVTLDHQRQPRHTITERPQLIQG